MGIVQPNSRAGCLWHPHGVLGVHCCAPPYENPYVVSQVLEGVHYQHHICKTPARFPLSKESTPAKRRHFNLELLIRNAPVAATIFLLPTLRLYLQSEVSYSIRDAQLFFCFVHCACSSISKTLNKKSEEYRSVNIYSDWYFDCGAKVYQKPNGMLSLPFLTQTLQCFSSFYF